MLHRGEQVTFGKLRVNADLEKVSNVLGLVFVDQLSLLGFDVSLFHGVKLPTLLDDFLDEVFRVAAKALDSFRHHEDVLDADTLAIFALLRLLKSVLEAGSALIDWRLS